MDSRMNLIIIQNYTDSCEIQPGESEWILTLTWSQISDPATSSVQWQLGLSLAVYDIFVQYSNKLS